MTEPRYPVSEFVRKVLHEERGARAAEVGLCALHEELMEHRSPERTVTRRAREAQRESARTAGRGSR